MCRSGTNRPQDRELRILTLAPPFQHAARDYGLLLSSLTKATSSFKLLLNIQCWSEHHLESGGCPVGGHRCSESFHQPCDVLCIVVEPEGDAEPHCPHRQHNGLRRELLSECQRRNPRTLQRGGWPNPHNMPATVRVPHVPASGWVGGWVFRKVWEREALLETTAVQTKLTQA